MENPEAESPKRRSPPPQQGPDPKKPKMSSTTTTSDDEAAATVNPRKPKYKRRKIAIFFAYCGVGYQGMQKNPGAKTIEGDLEEALFHAGAVPESDRGTPKRFDWARSARTDKGVSAVGQVVSGRFYIDPPGLVERLNTILPSQIRIFGFNRVTGSFNAKKFCDRRRYIYLIPVFALDPSCHRDRESVMASLGSGTELVKCFECSERGRKVDGLMGKRSYELRGSMDYGKEGSFHTNITGDKLNPNVVEEVIANEGNVGCSKDEVNASINNNSVDGVENQNTIEEANANGVEDNAANGLNSDLDAEKGRNEDQEGAEPVKGSVFRYGEEEMERFNRILKYYVGTHNFHNFTTRTKAEDPAAKRYIISFDASNTVTVEGIEFVKCEVVGQSFMLHQIRKMMGLAVAVMRNCAPESLVEKALQKDLRINVPTAPEVGLYLDECLFSSYNQKWKDTHEEISMKPYREEAEEFKMKYIYPHIASAEHKEGIVALWLHSLNHRNYSDLRADGNQVLSQKNATESVIEKVADVVEAMEA